MSSINDNLTIKDGDSDDIAIRAMDKSVGGDGTIQQMRHFAEAVPVDYSTGGCYRLVSKSGIMAAGLAANSPVYAFRWTSSTHLAILRRLELTAFSLGVGFAAGLAHFDLFRALSWTVADTNGTTDTISGDAGNLRTAMPATKLAELRRSATAALTAGTRTKDANPHASISVDAPTTTNKLFLSSAKLLDASSFDHPLVLAQNEGFVIEATVPATGTWGFAITPVWDEVPLTHY